MISKPGGMRLDDSWVWGLGFGGLRPEVDEFDVFEV